MKLPSKFKGIEPTPIKPPKGWTQEEANAFIEDLCKKDDLFWACERFESPEIGEWQPYTTNGQIQPVEVGECHIKISEWMEIIDTIQGIVCRANTVTGERIYTLWDGELPL